MLVTFDNPLRSFRPKCFATHPIFLFYFIPAVWECEGDTAEAKYRSWHPGEPNWGDERCAHGGYGLTRQWNNVVCSDAQYPMPTICKKLPAPTLYF